MDYTGMALALSCPRKYYYNRVQQIVPLESRAVLRFGKAWHALMEARNVEQKSGAPTESAESLVSRVLAGYPPAPDGEYRNYEKLLTAFKMYEAQWPRWEDVRVVEQPIFQMMEGIPEPFEGRVDAVVKADGEWWIVDYKTTSRLDADWIEQYEISLQFRLYTAMGRLSFPDLDIAGVLVDIYHATPGVKKATEPAARTGNHFYRRAFTYSPVSLDDALKTWVSAVGLAQTFKYNVFWPQNTTTCKQYNVACDYLPLCATDDPTLREALVAERYQPNTFNPLLP